MLKIKDMNLNNVIRQGDTQPRQYQLDTGNLDLNLTNKSATIRLMTADFQGIGYETTAMVSSDNKISFSIDDIIPAREYRLEITVDDYVFPSRALDGQFSVDPSSHGQEVNIIEIVGVNAVVKKAVDLINDDPNLIIDEDRLVSDIIGNTGIGSIEEYHQQFNDVIKELSEEKDYHSLPEIAGARGGFDTLGDRLNETTAQLAQTDSRISEITRSFKPKQARFALIDDDGVVEVLTKLKPMMDSRGFKGSFAVPTNQIVTEATGMLTNAQIQQMLDVGWEILPHTHSHTSLATVDDVELHYQLEHSQQVIKDYFDVEPRTMIYPYGAYDKRVIEATKLYYDTAVSTDFHSNPSPLPTYSIGRIGVGQWGNDNWDEIKALIDECIEYGRLGVFMTHISANSDTQNALLEQVLDYVASQGYVITTFKEAYASHKNIIDYGEYDEATKQMALSVGYDGAIGGYETDNKADNKSDILILPKNSVRPETPYTDIPDGKLSVCPIYHLERFGYPEDKAGILITNKLAVDGPSFVWQEYKILNSDTVYRRYLDDTTEQWSEFEREEGGASLGEKIDEVTTQLAQTKSDLRKDIEQHGFDLRWNEHLVVDGDWTQALQQALDDSPDDGRTIFIGQDVRIDSTIIWPNISGNTSINKPCTIQGMAKNRSSGQIGGYQKGEVAIEFTGEGALFDLRNGTNSQTDSSVSFRDINLYGKGKEGSIGINADSLLGANFENMLFRGFDVGMRARQVFYATFDNLRFFYNLTYGLNVEGEVNHAKFHRCNFSRTTNGTGARIYYGQTGVVFDGCWFESNYTALRLEYCMQALIQGCYFEANTNTMNIIGHTETGQTTVTFIGCNISTTEGSRSYPIRTDGSSVKFILTFIGNTFFHWPDSSVLIGGVGEKQVVDINNQTGNHIIDYPALVPFRVTEDGITTTQIRSGMQIAGDVTGTGATARMEVFNRNGQSAGWVQLYKGYD